MYREQVQRVFCRVMNVWKKYSGITIFHASGRILASKLLRYEKPAPTPASEPASGQNGSFLLRAILPYLRIWKSDMFN